MASIVPVNQELSRATLDLQAAMNNTASDSKDREDKESDSDADSDCGDEEEDDVGVAVVLPAVGKARKTVGSQ